MIYKENIPFFVQLSELGRPVASLIENRGAWREDGEAALGAWMDD
jgi:hypothetical protein